MRAITSYTTTCYCHTCRNFWTLNAVEYRTPQRRPCDVLCWRNRQPTFVISWEDCADTTSVSSVRPASSSTTQSATVLQHRNAVRPLYALLYSKGKGIRLTTPYCNKDCRRRGKRVWVTCPQSFRSCTPTRESNRTTDPHQQRITWPCDPNLWPFDLRVNASLEPVIICVSTDYGVNRSSGFPFRAQTHTQTKRRRVTDATDHHTHASAMLMAFVTSISANADGPRDAASHKIDHIVLHADCN